MKRNSTPPSAAETLPPLAETLTKSAARVAIHAESIHQIEAEAIKKSLLPRVLIGLHCLKAHSLFALKDPKARGKENRTKSNSRRELLPTPTYKDWLESTGTALKEPTTYKYMTAVRGLGCDHDSTEEQVTAAFHAYTNPTLAALCNAAVEPLQPPADPTPPQAEQLEFDLMRNTLSHYRESCNELLNTKDRLEAFPDMKRVATARVYQTLYELTGQHWQPSDIPNDYAHINPDSIEL